ncbi:Testis-expressed protein 264, partial [Dissostichus eleginoides]
MSDFILVVLLVVLLLCLIGTIGALIVYSGLLCDVIIKTGPPPVKNVTIAYKFNEGSYKDCGAAYTECCSIGPKLSTVGVFYDDPKQTYMGVAVRDEARCGAALEEGYKLVGDWLTLRASQCSNSSIGISDQSSEHRSTPKKMICLLCDIWLEECQTISSWPTSGEPTRRLWRRKTESCLQQAAYPR